MAVALPLAQNLPAAVPAPFRTPPDPSGLRPQPATVALVERQVDALLAATPSYHALEESGKSSLRRNMVKIAAYAAECVRDDWLQSERLKQRPLVRYRETTEGPVVARAQATFEPAATAQVGRVTQDTLKAIAFPTFVADLIKGTFEAITNSSIQQMEAYMRLLENAGKTVDQFMGENISDDQARDWLAQRYPDHIHVQNRKAVPRPGADERPAPDFQADLNVSDSVDLSSDEGIEDSLVPAARRKMAQLRLQMLSTMVLMGFSRIVVTGGKIRATMLFHIDASDRLRQEHATDMDFRAAASGSYGFGPWSVSASVSFAYVSSERSQSSSDINVSAELTGEVEIHFKSDYMPLERFATGGQIAQIQSNTAVPAANTPPVSENVPWGGTVQQVVQRPPEPPPSSTLTPVGSPLPPPRTPTAPTPPTVARHVDAPTQQPAQQSQPRPAPGSQQPSGGQQPAAGSQQPAAQPAQPAPAQTPAAGGSQPAAQPAQPAAAQPAPQPAPAGAA